MTMICPNCGKDCGGKWCGYCGTKLLSDNDGGDRVSSEQQQYNDNDYFPETPYAMDMERKKPSDERSSIYDDDSSYPYPESKLEDMTSTAISYDSNDDEIFLDGSVSEDERYGGQYEQMLRAEEAYESKSGKKGAIIIACVIATVLIVIASLIIVLFFGQGSGKKSDEESKPAQITENTQLETLKKKGERYISIGDYESAEQIYNQICDLEPDNSEAGTLYSILFNYNKAAKALENKDYKQAQKYSGKIPSEYTDYDNLSSDIDYLNEEITKCETAYETYQTCVELAQNGNYEDAAATIDLVDENRLSDSDKDDFEDLEDTVRQHLRQEEEKEKTKEETDTYRQLSRYDAEDLLVGYCNAFVDSINKKDFGIVAPYISSTSPMYQQQKNVVTDCIQNGTTERFDGIILNSLKRTGTSSWEVDVTEKETIYYSGGKSESKTFNWTYTIEYIDFTYYLTKIE